MQLLAEGQANKQVASTLVQRGIHCEIMLAEELVVAENKTLSINLKA